MNPELQLRADGNPWSRRRLQFAALRDAEEVAILFFDLSAPRGCVWLYEVFVAGAYRNQGVGSALLRRAEQIAQSKDWKMMLVRPRPLAPGISEDQLRRWYTRRGFRPWKGDCEVLAKRCSPVETSRSAR